MTDPVIEVSSEKSRLDLETLPGDEVETQIREVMNQPKEVIERVKKLSE